LAVFAFVLIAAPAGLSAQTSPEDRAVQYLTREVPRWRQEHPCYSCHNNGDAARALIAARTKDHALGTALDDTLVWLRSPSRWDANATGGGFDDKPLARIQFAGALASASHARLTPPESMRAAAQLVAADQAIDGSWRLDSSESVGSPATYGTALATWAGRRVLVTAQATDLLPAIARADRWLRRFDPKNIPDSAAVVLGLERATDADAVAQRTRALDVLRRGQSTAGGWGPYTNSPPEPFDTAVAVLALTSIDDALARPSYGGAARGTAIALGRRFLIQRQLPDGSWPETTRPAGQESYAQRISTTAWATLALIETR
jgi:hypothetical protein